MKDITAYEQRVKETDAELSVYAEKREQYLYGRTTYKFPTAPMCEFMYRQVRNYVYAELDAEMWLHVFRLQSNWGAIPRLYRWLEEQDYDVRRLKSITCQD